MNDVVIKRCPIDEEYSSYEELKKRHVVAQGWSESGDVSFFCELAEEDVDQYVKVLIDEGLVENRQIKPYKAFKGITHLEPGMIILGDVAGTIKGICEIPPDFCYVYDHGDGRDNTYEYANCIYPVQWIDWTDFCSDKEFQKLSLCNRCPGPLTNVKNPPEIRSFIMKRWDDYKKKNRVEIQPTECEKHLEEIKRAFPQKVQESRVRLEQMIGEFQSSMRCQKMIDEVKALVVEGRNVVFTGAPGTGKTFLAWQIASAMTGDVNPMEKGNEDEPHPHIGFCQFHPSMDYADFVEGLRPTVLGNGQVGFELKDGIFKDFCRRAALDVSNNYVFIIDEINRGDIAKIFGELFFAMDPGYRGGKGRIDTQYGNLIPPGDSFKRFYVPDNVYVIGTMNDIDRGVESMDFAIRRRFTWRDVKPEETQEAILRSKIKDDKLFGKVKNRMDNLNAAIRNVNSGLGDAYCIGGAYFTKNVSGNSCNFVALWDYHLGPLLREYLRGQEQNIIDARMKEFRKRFDDENPPPHS